MYVDTLLHIDGLWREAEEGATLPVHNPANGELIGTVAKAGLADLDAALAAAERGFEVWRNTSAFQRYRILRKAAELMRERGENIARLMTMEQGKPLAEARIEVGAAADIIDWFAEEARRSYGRIVPSRATGVEQRVIKEPVGPVAAFTPWNFPLNQAVRKLAGALAAGCSIILKAPEETPASPAQLIRAFVDAGIPSGVVGLVYGDPHQISSYLIAHPVIRKITFTGSTPVGKQLAALAGQHMKRVTMELGGHAPAIIFADADLDQAASMLAAAKFRNAGQVCVAPTRFLVERSVYAAFTERLVAHARAIKVGDGLDAGTTMGPLANSRRVHALKALVEDAQALGAGVHGNAEPLAGAGNYFSPTVIVDVTTAMKAMNEEPFGPLALLMPFDTIDQALDEANRLPYGLASFAFTRDIGNVQALSDGIKAGMLAINHVALGLPEIPFGGVGDSGYGSEGGTEAIEAYLNTKLVTQRA